jgi:hypothetical protein
MRLIITDEDGAIAQEYEGVLASADGIPVSGRVITVIIPGESGDRDQETTIMTGPDHYREADRLADIAYRSDAELATPTALVALTHAVLAVAAATALKDQGEGHQLLPDDRQAWITCASEAPAARRRRREAEAAELAELRTLPLQWYTSDSADDDNHDQEVDLDRIGSPGGASWASVAPGGTPESGGWHWVIYNRWTNMDKHDSELAAGYGTEAEAKAAVTAWVRAQGSP